MCKKSQWQVFCNEEESEHLRVSLLTGKAWQHLPEQHYPRWDVRESAALFKQGENWLKWFPFVLLSKLLPNSGWNVVNFSEVLSGAEKEGFCLNYS